MNISTTIAGPCILQVYTNSRLLPDRRVTKGQFTGFQDPFTGHYLTASCPDSSDKVTSIKIQGHDFLEVLFIVQNSDDFVDDIALAVGY